MTAIGTVTGQLVVLRPVAIEDLEAIRAIRADPRLRKLIMAAGPAETAEQQQRWFDTMDQRADQRIAVIASTSAPDVLGVIGLYDIDQTAHFATWGIYLNQRGARMTGASVEAALLLLDYAFSCGLERVGARVLEENRHVRSLLHRFAFRETSPQPADAVEMELSAADYDAARPAIARVIDAVAARSELDSP